MRLQDAAQSLLGDQQVCSLSESSLLGCVNFHTKILDTVLLIVKSCEP